ncbi:sensor histidine kinase [Halorussus salinus]|uniref:sensor histidine kinase n=1 Tax=Halorussus salinus TaxID=1364935 RepID=UPI0010922F44|nr:HAMP domain-containing sensor histidine kinase [Halorussus salinus]
MKRGVEKILSRFGHWFVAFAGATYVAFAVGLALLVIVDTEASFGGLLDFAIVGGPGLVLLYGGYRLPRSDIDPEAYSRVVAWCLGGFAIILAFLGLLHHEPLNPFRVSVWSATFSTAIGTTGGFLVGIYDARATTQARQLREQHRKLKEQREKLEDQREQLRRQNQRLDSFASLLAHELRNPIGIAQIYHEKATEGDPDAAAEVESALDRIEEMVEVILFIARDQSQKLDQEAVELATVAENAWDDIDSSHANLVVESDRTPLADAIHLRHLLENLFENAVEHGSTGNCPADDEAVEHGSTSSRPAADDAAEDADGSVTIRVGSLASGFYVEDDGPGIPEDERERVFEAGYTTDGTGFGLLFVAELAETYGWDYAITAGTDGGARFEFTNVDLADAADQSR